MGEFNHVINNRDLSLARHGFAAPLIFNTGYCLAGSDLVLLVNSEGWRGSALRELNEEKLGAVIDRFYEAAAQPDLWQTVLHETSIALHEYWRSCHGRTGVPANEIRAVELAPILPSLFLIDLDLTTGFQFRFCGATIATRYGRDLSDESFLTLWNPEDADAIQRHTQATSARGTGLVAGLMAETAGGGFTSFEMMILPLAGETGQAGAIGSMVRVGGHEEMNRIRARLVSQYLRSIRFLSSLPRPAPRGSAAVGRAQEAPWGGPKRYRHLTVVSGGA